MKQLSIHEYLRGDALVGQSIPSLGQILQRRRGEIGKGPSGIAGHFAQPRLSWLLLLLLLHRVVVVTCQRNGRALVVLDVVWTATNTIEIGSTAQFEKGFWFGYLVGSLAKGFVAVYRGRGCSGRRFGGCCLVTQ
jgi:hypothetical protein